jgi:hypothetical protein
MGLVGTGSYTTRPLPAKARLGERGSGDRRVFVRSRGGTFDVRSSTPPRNTKALPVLLACNGAIHRVERRSCNHEVKLLDVASYRINPGLIVDRFHNSGKSGPETAHDLDGA